MNHDETFRPGRHPRMTVNCQRCRSTLPAGHSVRQIECINFPSPGPTPEREKQSHLRTVLKWTAEPEMPSYARTGVKYSRDDPRILKIDTSLPRRMGGVRQRDGGAET